MQVRPINKNVIVVPLDKIDKQKGENPFSNFVVSNNFGTVKYISSEGITKMLEGHRVYFGSLYERIVMEGVEVLAMKEDNIIAWVKE